MLNLQRMWCGAALVGGVVGWGIFDAGAQVKPTPGTHIKMTTGSAETAPSPVVTPDPSPAPGDEATTPSAGSGGAAGGLGQDDVQKILAHAEAASSRTISLEGLRTTPDQKRSCRHIIFVVDRTGKVLGERMMPDAWVGSIDIALGKARTAAFYSSDENAMSTRQVGQLSQAHGPDGSGGAGPLWAIWSSNMPGSQASAGGVQVQRNATICFPGGLPLYKGGHLVGAIGVSGDGVDQDESVAFAGAEGYAPPNSAGSITPLKPKPVDWVAPPK